MRVIRRQGERPSGEHPETCLAKHYAHRGFHDKPEIPENSLAAFRRAVEHGFPAEFDVHMIADGSLVIFHDEQLERETGVIGQIEDYDITNLRRLRLEGTDEKIPELDEVLALYEDTGLPLLIELKTARGNYRELAEAVCRRLDSYTGEFVIESFDPRALLAVRRYRPDLITGQLVQNFLARREGLPFYQAVMLTCMIMNAAVKPGFIAYRYEDRRLFSRAWRSDNNGTVSRRLTESKSRRFARRRIPEAVWTIRTYDDYKAALDADCIPIFEQFDPEAK